AREIFIEEGDRPMPIRDGEKRVEMTAYRIAVRSAHISAAKGSAMAQRTVIQERLRIEAEISAIMHKTVEEIVSYKMDCAAERLRCVRSGRPAPRFAIDPDHYVLNYDSLTVEYQGPLAEQLSGDLRERIQCRDEWADDFAFCRDYCLQ